MTKILAIDSSTEACSVALQNNQQIVSRFEVAPRKHAELLLPMVNSILTEADISLSDLDAIGCCVGPGAFTGLRIAISVAQGLAYASQLPCIGVSSLQILATEAFNQSDALICLASIDARMQEVYFAGFKRGEQGVPIEVHSQQVIAAEKIELNSLLLTEIDTANSLSSNLIKVGTGWQDYQYSATLDSAGSHLEQIKYPNAEMMLPIALAHFQNGELLKPEFLQPVYLRNNVAKKKSQQK
jgi:tRNA threonylcarbamoyladenosine biosynthesis protein TsaB